MHFETFDSTASVSLANPAKIKKRIITIVVPTSPLTLVLPPQTTKWSDHVSRWTALSTMSIIIRRNVFMTELGIPEVRALRSTHFSQGRIPELVMCLLAFPPLSGT